MEKILSDVLSKDKSILTQRDKLIEILDEKVPSSLMLEYSALKTALQLNIGETFASPNMNLEEKKPEAVKRMTEAGMQKEFIDDVINTFIKALNLDRPKINITKESFVDEEKISEDIPKPKINTKKIKPNKPQKETKVETTDYENNNSNSNALVKLEKSSQVEENKEEIIIEEPVREDNNSHQFYNFNNFRNTTINAQVNRLDKIFTIQGRLNRQTYLIMGLKLFVLAFVGGLIGKWGIPLIIAAAVGNIMISIRRLHDLNRSGWFILIFCIPYVDVLFGLYLLFFKGTNGYNKYGPDPLINV